MVDQPSVNAVMLMDVIVGISLLHARILPRVTAL